MFILRLGHGVCSSASTFGLLKSVLVFDSERKKSSILQEVRSFRTKMVGRVLYDKGAPVFFLRLLNFGSLRPPSLYQKLIWRKIKTATPDEKIPSPINRYATRKWPIIYLFSDGFGLRSNVIQNPFQTKTATSTVARVGARLRRSMCHTCQLTGCLFSSTNL